MNQTKSKLPLNLTMAVAVRSNNDQNLKLAVAKYAQIPQTKVLNPKTKKEKLVRDSNEVTKAIGKVIRGPVAYRDWDDMAKMSSETFDACIAKIKEFGVWNTSRSVQKLNSYDLVMAEPDLKLRFGIIMLNKAPELPELTEIPVNLSSTQFRVTQCKSGWVKAIQSALLSNGCNETLVRDLIEASQNRIREKFSEVNKNKGAFYDLVQFASDSQQLSPKSLKHLKVRSGVKDRSTNVTTSADSYFVHLANFKGDDLTMKRFIVSVALLSKCDLTNKIRKEADKTPKNLFGQNGGKIILDKPLFVKGELWGFEDTNPEGSSQSLAHIVQDINNFAFSHNMAWNDDGVRVIRPENKEPELLLDDLFKVEWKTGKNGKAYHTITKNRKIAAYFEIRKDLSEKDRAMLTNFKTVFSVNKMKIFNSDPYEETDNKTSAASADANKS